MDTSSPLIWSKRTFSFGFLAFLFSEQFFVLAMVVVTEAAAVRSMSQARVNGMSLLSLKELWVTSGS